MGASCYCIVVDNVADDTHAVVDDHDYHKVHKCGLRKGTFQQAWLPRSWGRDQDSMHVHVVAVRYGCTHVDENYFVVDKADQEVMRNLGNQDELNLGCHYCK